MITDNMKKIQNLVEGYGGEMHAVDLPQTRLDGFEIFPETGYLVVFPWGGHHYVAEYDHLSDAYQTRKKEGRGTQGFVNDYDFDVFLFDADWKDDLNFNPKYRDIFIKNNPDYLLETYNDAICNRYAEEFGYNTPPKYPFSFKIEYSDYKALLEDRVELLELKKKLQ